MKHSKFRLFIGLLLVMTSVFSMMLPAAAADAKPLHYVAFDNEYYHDAIGNAYGFTNTEYIDVKDDENVAGAIRLTFEKSPYEYNGTYDKNGHTGVFDPYMYLPVYEMGEDLKCEGIGAVVVYVRFQNEEGHDLKVSSGDKAGLFVGTATHPMLTGQGDYIVSSAGYKRNSGNWIRLVFDVSKLPEWKGDLQLLRLDPLSQPNDDVDYYDVAGFATFATAKEAKSFDCNFKALKAGASETKTSAFSLGMAFACIVAAFGINGDLLKKKRVRTALVLALVAVLALGLVACGDKTDNGDKNSPATSATPAPEVDPEVALKAEKLQKKGESGDYEYELYETYSKITRYNGLDLDVTVPGEFEGLPVKIIGYKAFFRNYNLKDDTIGITKLTLPDSLVILDDYALAGLEEAVEIIFGKELYKIGSNSVENCYSLKKLTFTGTKLRVIESWAFSGDRVIEEIAIPDGVTTIENAAFQYCHSLAADKLSIPASVTTKGKALTFACTALPDGFVWP
ncbi:MAG: leucine-rich repeat domain-containing protein [Ruminococcaceae bacterium]|nr:leucine-rich repeat domain-containing protein [Oscillospiraceae bacterium]